MIIKTENVTVPERKLSANWTVTLEEVNGEETVNATSGLNDEIQRLISIAKELDGSGLSSDEIRDEIKSLQLELVEAEIFGEL